MTGAPTVGRDDLRPRDPLELADVSVAAVRRWFPELVTACLVLLGPTVLVGWAVAAVSRPAGLVVGAVGGVATLALAHATCVNIIGSGWLGASPTWRSSLTTVLRRSAALLLLWVAGLACVAVGAIVLVVPGVIVALGLLPAVPVLLLEGSTPLVALGRAFHLSTHRRVSHSIVLAALLLLVGIAVAVAAQPVLATTAVLDHTDVARLVVLALVQLAAATLVVPLLAAATTAVFLDSRVRTEGLDLSFLLQLIDVPAAPVAPPEPAGASS